MRYWKFLRAGSISPLTGFVWPAAGEWVAAGGSSPCRSGIHACRAADLPYWLVDELWQVELAGPVLTGRHKVVADRARLVARVPAWTSGAARDLAEACLLRTVEHAVAELRESGLEPVADQVAAAVAEGRPTGDLARAVDDGASEAKGRRIRPAARICGYVTDALEGIAVYPVASMAYISARAANSRTASADDDLYEAERAWQATWLVDRLGLADSG